MNKSNTNQSSVSLEKTNVDRAPLYLREDSKPVKYPTFRVKNDNALTSAQSMKATQYQIKCIQTKEMFKDMKSDWNNLLAESLNQTPFMLWEWIYTWWDVFENKNNKLFIITISDSEKLIAIAPFYITNQFNLLKRLSFLGEGENSNDAIVTHYPDILASEENREVAISKIVDYLRKDLETKRSFHYAKFDLIKPDSILHEVSKNLSNNLEVRRQFSGNQFLISLPSNDEDYVAGLSKSARKQFRLKHNRLKKLGDLEFKTEQDSSKGLDTVEKLHRARWDNITPSSVFDSTSFKLFHKKLCERLSGQDIVDIRTMSLNGTAIAAAYNFKYKNISYSYLSGFKSEDDNRLSPMYIFDLLELKRLIREGYDSFDLLVSESETNYKKRFGSKIIPCDKVIWITNSPSSFLLKSYFTIKPSLSKLYTKFKK